MNVEDSAFPTKNQLVLCTVKEILPQGAYVSLDEYPGLEGFLPLLEISLKRIRNIRDYIKEGQKLVLKVIRSDPKRSLIDLSLRRVSPIERKEKMLELKVSKREEAIMKHVAEKLGLSDEEIREIKNKLESEYGLVYEGLKEALMEGIEALTKVGIDRRVAEVIMEVAKDKVRIPIKKVKAMLTLKCYKPNGVEVIRNALVKAGKIEERDVKISIYVVSPPNYCIEVQSINPKKAEVLLKNISDSIIREVEAGGGEGSFKRIE